MIAMRFAIPAVSGIVVFGAVTAFASSLTVTSKSLASGNATVASCNATAGVSYTSVYSPTGPYGYKVAIAPVTSAIGCATMSYKVTLTGAANASLAEEVGTLDASGNGAPDFTLDNVDASLVTGASVIITG